MIRGIQTETGEAVRNMESGVKQVDRGKQLADLAGASLDEIVTMVQRVTDTISQMATAAEQQSSAAEQISHNVDHINSVTKETAAGAEQSAAAAEELSRQAEGLQALVSRFRLDGGNVALLHIAKSDHRLYVERLRRTLADRSSLASWKETDHHGCRFGRWCDSQGVSDFGHVPEFGRMEAPHIKVHQHANAAVRAMLAGDDAAAHRLLAETEADSHQTIEAIEALQRAVDAHVPTFQA